MWRVSSACQQAAQAIGYRTESRNCIGKAARTDGCKDVLPNIISITDNEVNHHSLMHEKNCLYRAGYTQVMIILIK